MPDVEKVIKGLRCCRNIHVGATLEDSCNVCPYQKGKGTCDANELFFDALALIVVRETKRGIVMADLISRAAAIDYLMTNMGWRDEDGYEVDDADEKRAIITDLVNGIPAVDAVPVVRCEDCWKRGLDNCPMEFYWDNHPADDVCYCAMGERKENE